MILFPKWTLNFTFGSFKTVLKVRFYALNLKTLDHLLKLFLIGEIG